MIHPATPLLFATLCSAAALGQACPHTQVQKFRPADSVAGDAFAGSGSFEISGDLIIAGSRYHDQTADDAGAAYIFRFDGMTWVEEQELLASDGQAEDWFGWEVGIHGETVFVGAFADDDLGEDSGSVYVFGWNGSAWVEEQKLNASDAEAGDLFGRQIALGDGVALIGAWFADGTESSSGAAYIFRYNGSTWVEEQKLMPADGESGDGFGGWVALSGDTALIGAPFRADAGGNSGAAYVFRWNGTAWVEEDRLNAGDADAGDTFGNSVALAGNTAVIGAVGDNAGGSSAGAAYVFNFDGADWSQVQKLAATDAHAGARFGYVAINESAATILIGARGDNEEGSGAGAAYVFRHNGTAWTQTDKLLASDGGPDDALGWHVAIQDETGIVGARGDDGFGVDSGAAYVYDLDRCPADVTRDGRVDFADLNLLLDDWGSAGGEGETNCDGSVDFEDLNNVLEQWGCVTP